MSEELITEEKPSEEQTLLDLQMLYNNIDPLTGKKKRGRKPKALKEQELKAGIVYEPKPINSVPKKRGRKPPVVFKQIRFSEITQKITFNEHPGFSCRARFG